MDFRKHRSIKTTLRNKLHQLVKCSEKSPRRIETKQADTIKVIKTTRSLSRTISQPHHCQVGLMIIVKIKTENATEKTRKNTRVRAIEALATFLDPLGTQVTATDVLTFSPFSKYTPTTQVRLKKHYQFGRISPCLRF